MCRACGVYIGALLSSDGREFGIVNLNALDAPLKSPPEPSSVVYDAEEAAERVARREASWTPVVGDL